MPLRASVSRSVRRRGCERVAWVTRRPRHGLSSEHNVVVSRQEVDRYLAGVEEPKRATLQKLRETIHEILPDAEEVISYGMPAFKRNGKVIAGFAAFKSHLAYLPHSGSVFSALKDELAGYRSTEGSLHFPIDKPLPKALVKKLIAERLRQINQS